jgi:hypothetical protein
MRMPHAFTSQRNSNGASPAVACVWRAAAPPCVWRQALPASHGLPSSALPAPVPRSVPPPQIWCCSTVSLCACAVRLLLLLEFEPAADDSAAALQHFGDPVQMVRLHVQLSRPVRKPAPGVSEGYCTDASGRGDVDQVAADVAWIGYPRGRAAQAWQRRLGHIHHAQHVHLCNSFKYL